LGDVHYLNSGDWVESLTAIVEYEDGRFEVLYYKEFCKRLEDKARLKAEQKGKQTDMNEAPEPQPLEENEPGHGADRPQTCAAPPPSQVLSAAKIVMSADSMPVSTCARFRA
jgi:hypothetical protein